MSRLISTSDESVVPGSSLQQDDSNLPAALRVPTQSKSPGWQLFLSLANLVVWMCTIPTFQILLPNQINALDSANKVALLAGISLAGGIAAILGNLLAGALSDRTTSHFGRRRPWILAGALLSALSLVLLGLAPTIPVVAIGVILFQFCINLDIASLAALVPDQVPLRQRATASAFVGLALPVGSVVGLALIAQVFNGARISYFMLAAVLVVVIVLFVLFVRDAVLPKDVMPAFQSKQFFASFFRPLKSQDFSLTLIGRTFVIFGYYTVVGYLLYYLQDVVHYSQATQGVALFQVLSTVVLVVATITSGAISDRLQRRKPFVIIASCTMALALIILAFFPLWPLVLVAAAILGLGFGIFLSGDLALQTQVLPERHDNGKDLAILNTANLLPQILVPIVVGVVLAIFHSYSALFLIGAITACVGAGVIVPVKSVR
ncbi:MFS transporter [Dictyobacter aurantiacus]|uniref:MFS transporter n=1 Tax=Dictyobacter aurantiacus TaxID=1936993 RepID=A0A401ZGA7_9CHLR|nr:MFS transporter [Dictyobacter aurantiacus]GCE05924.1 MFS transporter [Dictyobacter aurantiacus]